MDMQHVFVSPDKASILEAGAAGAVLSMFMFQGQLTWRSAIPILLAGELVSFYATIPVSNWLGINASIVGFSLGLTGMYLCSIVINLLATFVKNPRDILQYIPGVKKPTDP
jgi:hypothetical protein